MSYHRLIELLLATTGTDRQPSLADILRHDPRIFERPLNDSEAAELLGCTAQSLQVRRSRGSGPPYIKDGKSVRYVVGDLLDWRASRRVNPKSRKES